MQPTTWHHVPHHRTLHHHTPRKHNQPLPKRYPDGTAEGWCTPKTRFGHRTGWSPCAHSTGKFFLWFKVFPAETSARGSSGNYLYVFDSFDQYSLYSLIFELICFIGPMITIHYYNCSILLLLVVLLLLVTATCYCSSFYYYFCNCSYCLQFWTPVTRKFCR